MGGEIPKGGRAGRARSLGIWPGGARSLGIWPGRGEITGGGGEIPGTPVQVHSLVSHKYHSIHQDWGLWNSERMYENNIFIRRLHKHFEFLLRRHHIHDI